MIDFGESKWTAAQEFDVIMNVIWDTYNNWGLREGINAAAVHSPVPYYAWDKPAKGGSANNPTWGIATIKTPPTLCVNGLWQTSKHGFGANLRNQKSWKKGSLVRALVDRTLMLLERVESGQQQQQLQQPYHYIVPEVFLLLIKHGNEYMESSVRVVMLCVAKVVCHKWDDDLQAQYLRVLMKRMVFSRLSGNLMRCCGLTDPEKFLIAGQACEAVNQITLGAIQSFPAPPAFSNNNVVALALLKYGARKALSEEGERAVFGVVDGIGGESASDVDAALAMIVRWTARSQCWFS